MKRQRRPERRRSKRTTRIVGVNIIQVGKKKTLPKLDHEVGMNISPAGILVHSDKPLKHSQILQMKIVLTKDLPGGIIPNTPIMVPEQAAGAVGVLIGPHPINPAEFIVEIGGNRYSVTRDGFDVIH